MKRKFDFVTNSSSTSFILSASKEVKQIKYSITVEFDLMKKDTRVLDSIEELNQWFSEEDYDYQSMADEINAGKVVYVFGLHTDDDDSFTKIVLDQGLNQHDIKTPGVTVVREPDGI